MSQPDSKLADDEEEVVGEEEMLLEETSEEGEEEESSPKKKKRAVVLVKPKANVYTMMLVISLVALVIGCLCLWGELQQYGGQMRPGR